MRAPWILAALLAALVSAPAAGRAQGPPAAPTPTAGAPDESGLVVRYSAGVDGNLALGAVDRLLVNLRGDALVTTPAWGLYLEPRWTHAEVDGAVTDSEWYLRTVGFVRPRDPIYGFAVGLAERSLRRAVDARLTGGAGVGFNLIRRRDLQLLVAQGLVLETTWFARGDLDGWPDEPDRERTVVRAASRASGRLPLSAGGSLFFDLYLKPSITDPRDLRILARGSLELSLGSVLVARLLLDLTHEEVVVAGTSRGELMLGAGVAIRRD